MNARRHIRLLTTQSVLLSAAILTAGCELKNYSGKLPAADIFMVHATPQVTLSLRSIAATDCNRSLRDRGRFKPGPVTFTAVMLEPTPHDEDCPAIENQRTISFTGAAGKRYRLSPVLKPGAKLLDLPSPKAYAGYLLEDTATGAIVAQVP